MRPEKIAVRTMTLEEALTQVSNEVYRGSYIIEGLEGAQKIFGNGHHSMQNVAMFAQLIVLRQWRDKDEVTALSDDHPAKQLYNRGIRTDLENMRTPSRTSNN